MSAQAIRQLSKTVSLTSNITHTIENPIVFAFCLRKPFPLLLHETETLIVYSQNGNVADPDQTTRTALPLSKSSDRTAKAHQVSSAR